MKRPAFQFYAADWRKDAALQSCSLAAQGLWINAMCIAHECKPYGHLSVNGKAMTTAQLARLVGITPRDCDKLMAELDGAGVPSRAEDGAIYSRRMVRDERLRNIRAASGRLGGNPNLVGTKVNQIVNHDDKQSPTPSSSSSSSSSSSKIKNKGQKLAAEAALVLPDWVPKDQWEAWIESRKKRRNAPTAWALRLALVKLEHLRDEGHSPAHILANSAFNGWSGLFPPKDA